MHEQPIRNIAIIAHVDHGKTTLVDKMLVQTQVFKEHQAVGELIMDSGELERERGITITAKNLAIQYKGTKINVLDTPGHADFGGEVERVLRMADGVLLLVDAFEGPMPQTRFVTQKALELGLRPIVVVNKVDKPNCQPDLAVDQIFDLLANLDATEEQLDFPQVFGSGKNGWMGPKPDEATADISYLLDVILEHVPPSEAKPGPVQLQVTSLDYSNYVGRIAIGKVARGTLKAGQRILLLKADGSKNKGQIKELHVFEGLGRRPAQEVHAGDICAIVGLEGFEIGDTVADAEQPEALPPITVEEPTLSMEFRINDSPFFGQEGEYVTSRQLRDRLFKEMERNLALRVEETGSADSFQVFGRGVLHLAVLIETMRREGYEFAVGQPIVLIKEIDGRKCEPFEQLVVDVPEAYSGAVIQAVSKRRGELQVMEPKGEWQHLEFRIPSRGLIGLRTELLTNSRGEATVATRFDEYAPYQGEMPGRGHGVVISKGQGPAIAYALFNLQERATFFIEPGPDVYGGQIIGETNRDEDLTVNVQKSKKLSNVRAAGSDDAVLLSPPKKLSLEQCLEYIAADELVEVTPKAIRLRKRHLDETQRKIAAKKVAQ